MSNIIVYSEKTKLALELISAAKEIAVRENLNIQAITINNSEQAQELSRSGVDVHVITAPESIVADTAAWGEALTQAADKLDANIILLASDRRGKELAGRLAQKLGAGCLTDVKAINSDGSMVRNSLGGATVATQVIRTEKKIIALSPNSFPAAEEGGTGNIQELSIVVPVSTITLQEKRNKAGDSVDIEAASTLIVVGQGVEEHAQLDIIHKIAAALGGEVACSKPVATDKKWFSEERVVGLSGKICKPELALLLGVSGQVQFTVGIREANTIVSINIDENAYINQLSDYYLVADIKEVLPEIAKHLE
jgi:electron transfer flavoprotein alpha subunit